MNLDPSWPQETTSWRAKLARAWEHIESLKALVGDYRRSQPYEMKPERTDVPGRAAYRLQVWRPQPLGISTTVGDIVHNLRGALENLAYELARRGQGRTLSPDQEWRPTFPIYATPEDFERFFTTGKCAGLFDGRAQRALRDAQSFKHHEEAVELGAVAALEALGQPVGSLEDDFKVSALHRLNVLWNIDKHRRLVPTEWLLRDFWWPSNGPTNRRPEPGDGKTGHDAILFYLVGSDDGVSDEVYHHLNLVLVDDLAFDYAPGWSVDVVVFMEQFHSAVDHVIRRTAWLMGEN